MGLMRWRQGWLAGLAVGLAGAGLWGGDWRSERFPAWSEATVMRVLTDSPWARVRRVRLEWHKREQRPLRAEDVPGTTGPNMQRPGLGPLGGIGTPRSSLPLEAELIIRWTSALPVRQATALYRAREEKRAGGGAVADVDGAPADVILEIHGIPAEVGHAGAGTVEAAAVEGIVVQGPRGAVIRPSKAEAKMQGLTLDLYVHFRRAAFEAGPGALEVRADLQIFRLRERFRLREMVYGGRLEI